MYPEGFLIDPEGTKLFSFKQDSLNPNNEGFIESWRLDATSKQFIFRKRLSKSKALKHFDHLYDRGWKSFDPQQQAA